MKIQALLISFLSTLIFIGASASAQETVSPEISFQLGVDVRIESTVNPEIKEPIPAGTVGLFILYDRFALLEELAFLSDSSAAGNFKIEYQTLEWNQWIHYLVRKEQTFKPYFGAGLGVSQDKVDTILSGVKRTDRSRLFVNAGAAAGLLMELGTKFELLGELRAWKFEQKKDPMFSGLVSLRFH